MKSLSFSAIFLLLLFITAGKDWTRATATGAAIIGHEVANDVSSAAAVVARGEPANAIGSCDVVGHGGGCVTEECFSYCQGKYGQTAHGFCFAISTPDDTCLCRHPC